MKSCWPRCVQSKVVLCTRISLQGTSKIPVVLPVPRVTRVRATATPTLTVVAAWSVAPTTVLSQPQALPPSPTAVRESWRSAARLTNIVRLTVVLDGLPASWAEVTATQTMSVREVLPVFETTAETSGPGLTPVGTAVNNEINTPSQDEIFISINNSLFYIQESRDLSRDLNKSLVLGLD